MRASHRAESVVRIGLALLIALALPVAAAIGTGAYTTRVEQTDRAAAAAHEVQAVVDTTPKPKDSVLGMVAVTVHWTYRGKQHTGTTMVDAAAKAGDPATIWIGPDGEQTAKPPSRSEAMPDAVAVAVGCYGLFSAFLLAVWHATGRMFARWRCSDWSREWAALAGIRKWNHL
jgi:hypothetical protein